MMGREAVNVARGFAARIPLDGLILTKLDGDSRGGAALAIRAATGVPIRFVAMGEATDKLESFRPEGLAQRVLGQGDVVGLMQDFEAVVDVEEAEKDAERMLRGKFRFEDFLSPAAHDPEDGLAHRPAREDPGRVRHDARGREGRPRRS